MGIVIGVAIAVGLAALIFFLRKPASKPLPPAEGQRSPSEPTSESSDRPQETQPTAPTEKTGEPQEAPSTAAPDRREETPEQEEPKAEQGAGDDADAAPTQAPPATEPEEGIQLDETEEDEAARQLEQKRKERKLAKLRQGLSKTRGGFISRISKLFSEPKQIDAALLEELEEVLISADVGAKTTQRLIEALQDALDKNELSDADAVWNLLRDEVREILNLPVPQWDIPANKPFTIMVVGVNGAGKTTTIGKIASRLTEEGHKVVLAAGDTFRAAAVNQLEIWGRRTGCPVVPPSKEGADPSSVVYDAIKKAQQEGADVVIADTAGRLHTQAPLMEELKKVARVMGKAQPGAPHEILMVIDATCGQNAVAQVKEFSQALDITSLALTKLDGTAKGGVIIGIANDLKIPVRYIGIGESKDSLRPFDVDSFVDALFLRDGETE